MSRYFVTMPQLGESVTEGTIMRWMVRPGDQLSEFDAMVEINTDKVDAEVPAPVTGELLEILAAEGAVVPVGGNIAVIEIAESAREYSAGQGSIPPPASIDTPVVRVEETELVQTPRSLAEVNHDSSAANQGDSVASAQEPEHSLADPIDGDEAIPLSPIRRRIAQTMSLSKSTIPHAWQVQEVDMSGVATSIAGNKDTFRRQRGASLSYLSYVAASVITSVREHPTVNATFAGDHIVVHRGINIGIAVGLPEGVVVPVITRANRLSISEIAAAVTEITARARAKRLSLEDLKGATVTINNSGALGTLLSYSVIAPGQSAVLTMGAVIERPIAIDGKAIVKPMMYLSLSIDHRVLDGLEASRFLGSCKRWLEGVTIDTHLSEAVS